MTDRFVAVADANVPLSLAAPLVAEDLGVITKSVLALRKAYSRPGMQVLQFRVDRVDVDEGCVCCTGMHDNDTTEGWYAGSEVAITGETLESLQRPVLDNVEGVRDSVYKVMISLCFSRDARLAMAPLRDYLGLDSSTRLDAPGRGEGNWRWRVRAAALDGKDLTYSGEQATRYGRT